MDALTKLIHRCLSRENATTLLIALAKKDTRIAKLEAGISDAIDDLSFGIDIEANDTIANLRDLLTHHEK